MRSVFGLPLFLLCVAVGLLGGCKSRPEPGLTYEPRIFSGVLDVQERVELSPSANVRLSLVEFIAPGEPPKILVTSQLTTRGRQFPIAFEVGVDPRLLRKDGRYAITASIAVGGQLRFVAAPPSEVDPSKDTTQLKVLLSPPRGMR